MNPFDAAWALLKQWDDTDWTGVPQIDSEGGMARQPAPVTEDPWTGVDWSDWMAQRQREGTTDHDDLGDAQLRSLAHTGDMDAMRALARQGNPKFQEDVRREDQRRAVLAAHNDPYQQALWGAPPDEQGRVPPMMPPSHQFVPRMNQGGHMPHSHDAEWQPPSLPVPKITPEMREAAMRRFNAGTKFDTAHHLPPLHHHNTRLTNAQRFPESASALHLQELAEHMR